MKVSDLIQLGFFKLVNDGNNTDREISGIYCCDLLSIAMGKMPAGSAWVTVMSNINTLAVASLADAACVILAESGHLDATGLAKAKEQGITVFETELPVFDAALAIYKALNA